MVFGLHLHDSVEILYVKSGEILVTIDGEEKLLRKDECVIIFPNMIHGYRTLSKSRILLSIFKTSAAGSYYHTFANYYPIEPFLTKEQLGPDMLLALRRMEQHAIKSPDIAAAWLQLFLSYLMPCLDLTKNKSSHNTDATHQLLKYLAEHFKEPLTLTLLAEKLHFNREYLSRIFNQKLHAGFSDYLNQLRLDYVLSHMGDSELNLTEMWQEAGFGSQRTFNRAFYKHFGVSPSKYRNQIIKQRTI